MQLTIQIRDLDHLRIIREITYNDIQEVSTYTTYQNIIAKTHNPSKKTREIFMKLFWISENEFNELIK